ncbi:hypothetical protein IVB11_29845 [Bradyrhizobium sp. 177]|uniref:hypothetical protein n=1 Tax=Bradyrhizobium sp. 177 TaxID=2782647 RepID=UPI001FF95707|nr:hypothetical protein [Bradyrhizobium sp. 177]MCK1553129.1 hypothetical protein [Bradyrhizobium sp. 177]
MITDDQLDDLPEGDLEAFVAYEAILRRNLNEDRNNQGWDAEVEYVTCILAFVEIRHFDLNVSTQIPADGDVMRIYFNEFLQKVDAFKIKARLELAARRKASGTVFVVAGNYKTQIGGHLTAIRKIVHEADLSESKRDAIFKRVEKLQFEVDRDRTRSEAAVGLWLDISSAIGQGAKNLDPAIERLERIMKIFAQARDEDTARLPAPKEQKRIPPPASDDDIPF